MDLIERIDADLKSAMKSGDATRAETLKMLKSDMSYEKAKTGEKLSDEQMLEIISRSAKRRRESIKEFQKANRQDLVENESNELKIVEEYLPAQMNETDIKKHISDKLSSLETITQKDFGRVMGEIMKELKGKADGATVKAILSEKLEKK